MDCKFVLGNMTLQSNKTATFVEEARKLELINPRFGYIFEQEETEYTSSKLFEINPHPFRNISSLLKVDLRNNLATLEIFEHHTSIITCAIVYTGYIQMEGMTSCLF